MGRNRSENMQKLWKFVRTQKSDWDIPYACQLSRVPRSSVIRYMSWLEKEGFITRRGKNGPRILYQATGKADRSPETPYPPTAKTITQLENEGETA